VRNLAVKKEKRAQQQLDVGRKGENVMRTAMPARMKTWRVHSKISTGESKKKGCFKGRICRLPAERGGGKELIPAQCQRKGEGRGWGNLREQERDGQDDLNDKKTIKHAEQKSRESSLPLGVNDPQEKKKEGRNVGRPFPKNEQTGHPY